MSQLFQRLRFEASERYYEYRLGIRTADETQIVPAEGVRYSPIPYRHLFVGLRMLNPGPNDVFVDYGCGSGRAIVGAARFPVREVIGIELVPELIEKARSNIRRARWLRCRNIRVVCANAADVALPDQATVVFFYNPFFESVLRSVVTRIRESLDRNPRRLTVLYFNRARWAKETAQLPWVRTRAEFAFAYPRIGCGIYDCS